MFNALNSCDCLYIPHFHKEPRFSEKDIAELDSLLKDKSRLFKETSDYRSLGVYSNFDYSVIIGSDVQDWNKYEQCTFADIRLPIQTFEQFCLLARKDSQVIDTLLNQKKKKELPVSPAKDVHFRIPIYEDINILFGQKGTGKSEILESLKKYYVENGTSLSEYTGSQKETDFQKLLKINENSETLEKLHIEDMADTFNGVYSWQEVNFIHISNYIHWEETRDNNKNKGSMKITNAVNIEEVAKDRKLQKDAEYIKSLSESTLEKINVMRYLSSRDVAAFKRLLNKLSQKIYEAQTAQWIDEKSTHLTNWSINKIKEAADKCSDTVSKPGSTGFTEFALNRFELFDAVNEIIETFSVDECCEKEYVGQLEEKGDVYIQTRYRILCDKSRKEEFGKRIRTLQKIKASLENIRREAFGNHINEKIIEFQDLCDSNDVNSIEPFIGVSKEPVLGDGKPYKPSNGEQGILLMQKMLDNDADVYIMDEPELGMGNSYITASILPKIIGLSKRHKTVIIATHNANIAVGSMPYVSILRTHENGDYKTYVGNPFCDELVNIEDSDDKKNWTAESMHTLEGGREAFYGRKNIYESGTV